MARRGPARPGQDPTLETAVAVVACLIIGVLLWASKPLEVNGKPVSAAQFMRDTAAQVAKPGKTPAKPPGGEKSPTVADKTPDESPAVPDRTPDASPTKPTLPTLKAPPVFQVAMPFETADLSAYAPEVRKLFEATIRAGQSGNVLLASKYRKDIRNGNDILQAEKDNLTTLKFANPAWRGAHKKVAAAVSIMAAGSDLVYQGKESDDDIEGEMLEKQGRAKLQAGMRKLQKVVNYMEILRKKNQTAKA